MGNRLLDELTAALRLVVLVNHIKKNRDCSEQRLQAVAHLKQMLAHVEVVNAYLLTAWKLKFVSNAVMVDFSSRLGAVAKQGRGWLAWFAGVGKQVNGCQ